LDKLIQRRYRSTGRETGLVIKKLVDYTQYHFKCARIPGSAELTGSTVNEALEHLKAGKARYRSVFKNDF
jgi:hypothetical protein